MSYVAGKAVLALILAGGHRLSVVNSFQDVDIEVMGVPPVLSSPRTVSLVHGR